uniref:Carboxylic ester hydrolase n=1 Tax=Caenorhabditis tropicalis TaxID=1561998 RepID=A0A1I7TA10_9PELO
MGGFLSHLKPENNLEVLNASCGPIRGNIYRHGEKIVHGYLGIAYAKPPIDDLRFKKPIMEDTWKEPRDCYKCGPSCPQSGDKAAELFPPGYREFDEATCLNLNVFAPGWKSEEFPNGYPVMVYFHGGGFELGISSSFDDYSLSGTLPLKEVIVVTVNYRLGPLGFFTTGDKVSPGNYGLWDMTLSLKWVQKHIHSFGGNPNSVTVFGSSAGGMAAGYLALSPHSNKLFHRYMPMSGAAFCDFACRSKENAAKVARNFAKRHGYTGEGTVDSKSLLEWFKSQPNTKWFETNKIDREGMSGFAYFTPVFDGDFFPKPFDQLLKEAPKLDVMVTVNEYEGLGFLLMYPDRKDDLEIIKSVFGPDVVRNPEEVQNKIYDFYMKDIDQTDKKAVDLALINFISDSWFNHPALETVRLSTKAGNNAYLASFDYYNMESKDPYSSLFPFRAANHNSELKYMMGEGMGKFEPIEEEFKVIELMGILVTNFAKYGNPNGVDGPQIWEKYSLEKPNSYFKIDYPKCEMRDNFQYGRLRIYDEINESGEKYQGILYSKTH